MNKVGYHLPEDHPAAFAATHEGYEALRWRVPSTIPIRCISHSISHRWSTVKRRKSAKDQSAKDWATACIGQYRWDEETGWIARGDQDRCAQESQGPIFDRSGEHLGVSDEGVILLRRMFKQSIDAVQQRQDPVGIIRDPVKNKYLRLGSGRISARIAKIVSRHKLKIRSVENQRRTCSTAPDDEQSSSSRSLL